MQTDDNLTGAVEIKLRADRRPVMHRGVKIELIGQIECLKYSKETTGFLSLGKELELAGAITFDTIYKFDFGVFEKRYETFAGASFRIRYFLRVTVFTSYRPKIEEFDFAVYLPRNGIVEGKPITMEVGIEECLHIVIEVERDCWDIRENIVGNIHFILAKMKLEAGEVQIIRKEIIGTGPSALVENMIAAKFMVMEGHPCRDASIPFNIGLENYNLCPTMKNINNRFSVTYLLKILLFQKDNVHFFKQVEITLQRGIDK